VLPPFLSRASLFKAAIEPIYAVSYFFHQLIILKKKYNSRYAVVIGGRLAIYGVLLTGYNSASNAFINFSSKEQHHALLWRQKRVPISLRGARRVPLHVGTREGRQKKKVNSSPASCPESYTAASRASDFPFSKCAASTSIACTWYPISVFLIVMRPLSPYSK
jgi:hypothetical protein